jgi:transcriptional regulator with XRE-family HTH domain
MTERPPAPPEGQLITDAIQRAGLSIREASRRAGISYGRWRQITTGFQNISPGTYAPVRAPAATLARMAAAARVTPAQLTQAGRADAAQILADIADTPPPPPDDSPGFVNLADATEEYLWRAPGMSAPERKAVIAFLRAARSVEGAAALDEVFHSECRHA